MKVKRLDPRVNLPTKATEVDVNLELDCEVCGQHYTVGSETSIRCISHVCRKAELKNSKHNATCYICKTTFHIKASQLAKRVHKDKITCSRACSAVARKELMSGENNHQFGLKGELNSSHLSDIRISSYGYILVKNDTHPLSHYDGYMLLHRLVYEEYLRTTNDYTYLTEIDGIWVLNPTFVVHHIDENKLNNSLSNLELSTLAEHSARHSEDRTIIRDSLGRISTVVGEIKSGTLARNKRLDAGQDIKSSIALTIPAKESAVVSTGLVINVPEGYVGLVWSRSGLSVKHKLEVGAGCIDSGYNGEVLVHLYNHGSYDYTVEVGDKIAQLLTLPVSLNSYEQVDEFKESQRGLDGFGSSGY